MQIGERVRRLRMEHNLTQEELANRSELTKGYISQIERDLSSPSIATLLDILEALGTTIAEFFNEVKQEKIAFCHDDWFEKTDATRSIQWIIPNAQKNDMEPILLTLQPLASSPIEDPHHGEEFGYVLQGAALLHLGSQKHRINQGNSFYFRANDRHYITNASTQDIAKILWVSTPPTF